MPIADRLQFFILPYRFFPLWNQRKRARGPAGNRSSPPWTTDNTALTVTPPCQLLTGVAPVTFLLVCSFGAVVVVLWCSKPKGRGSIPGWAAALLRWFQSGRKRLGRIKIAAPVRNWHGGVIVKAVLFVVQGGEDPFPAGRRALLRWFQRGKNRLGRIKNCSRSAIGTVL